VRLQNETPWNTGDLRKLIYACAKHRKISLQRVPVIAKSWRGRSIGSYEFPDRGRKTVILKIAVPTRFEHEVVQSLSVADTDTPFGTLVGDNLYRAANVIIAALSAKEVGVCYRPPHSPTYYGIDLSDFVLRPAAPVRKERVVGIPLQQQKLEKARARLKVWRKKLALAETKVDKYEREVKKRLRNIADLEKTNGARRVEKTEEADQATKTGHRERDGL
jgi:hypothetical protein